MYIKPSTLILGTLIALNSVIANADLKMMVKDNPSLAATEAYWTPERMQAAVPMDLPQVNHSILNRRSATEVMQKYKGQKTVILNAAAPLIYIKPNIKQIFKPIEHSVIKTLDSGSLNEYFTSARLIPLSADLNYPYTTVGKLFFTTPAGDRTCSGVVLGNRIVATAGHCMHSGNGQSSGWYANWAFIPAYRDGAAPLNIWHYNTSTLFYIWYTSGGVVPNPFDYGFLSFSDQNINGVTIKLGEITGKLGIKTLNTIPNHAHLLGYPGNLDNGQKMHQVTAQSAVAVDPDNAEYGSDMSSGTGGGPWIQNFGPAADGQFGGKNADRNMLIGITSYGFNDTTSLGNGSPILDANFISLFNYICGFATDNC